jgi:hypothetical protein
MNTPIPAFCTNLYIGELRTWDDPARCICGAYQEQPCRHNWGAPCARPPYKPMGYNYQSPEACNAWGKPKHGPRVGSDADYIYPQLYPAPLPAGLYNVQSPLACLIVDHPLWSPRYGIPFLRTPPARIVREITLPEDGHITGGDIWS